jgi:hypothetical protein
MKSRRMRLGHVTYMGEMRISCRILIRESPVKDCCGDKDVDGRRI